MAPEALGVTIKEGHSEARSAEESQKRLPRGTILRPWQRLRRIASPGEKTRLATTSSDSHGRRKNDPWDDWEGCRREGPP